MISPVVVTTEHVRSPQSRMQYITNTSAPLTVSSCLAPFLSQSVERLKTYPSLVLYPTIVCFSMMVLVFPCMILVGMMLMLWETTYRDKTRGVS
jgi:hypothetical protein